MRPRSALFSCPFSFLSRFNQNMRSYVIGAGPVSPVDYRQEGVDNEPKFREVNYCTKDRHRGPDLEGLQTIGREATYESQRRSHQYSE